jgi:hypothetical protein
LIGSPSRTPSTTPFPCISSCAKTTTKPIYQKREERQTLERKQGPDGMMSRILSRLGPCPQRDPLRPLLQSPIIHLSYLGYTSIPDFSILLESPRASPFIEIPNPFIQLCRNTRGCCCDWREADRCHCQQGDNQNHQKGSMRHGFNCEFE